MSVEAEKPDPHVVDDSPVEKPPQEDTYFVRDGKPFTGPATDEQDETEPDAAAKPAEGEPKPKDPAPKPAEKPKSKADEWKEIRAEKKAAKETNAALTSRLAEVDQLKEQLESELRLFQTDFYGFVKKRGIDLRDVLERDLKERDATPEEKERRLQAQSQDEMKRELEAIKQKLQESERSQQKMAEVGQLETYAASVAEDYPRVAARIKHIGGEMWDDFQLAAEQGKRPTVDKLFQSWEALLERFGVQPPTAASPRPGAVNGAAAKRKGAGRSARHAEEELDDEGNDAPSATGPATLTNRMASERRSNGRRPSKDEHLQNALSLLQNRDD